MDENILKTKKPLQILMSRNHTLENWNNCDDNIAGGSYNETNSGPLEIKVDTESKKMDQTNKESKADTTDGQPKTNAISEENFVEKIQFEEIENKLEEMFAGIEDEQLTNTTLEDKSMSKSLIDSTDKSLEVNCNGANTDKELSNANYSSKSSTPTKAAQNSSSSLPRTESTKQLNLLFRDYKNPSIPKSMLYLKSMPPRRRLSIGINKDLLNLSINTSDKVNKIKSFNNITGEEDMTPHSYNIKTHEQVKRVKNNVPKNKINTNNQKKCSKYKKEINYIKSKSSGIQKTNRKSESPIKDKQSRQKVKQTRLHRLISSENDAEEKQLQTKDIETKNRSPFILVKSNGSVTVVNTVSPDDSNEKSTRSKKPNNSVFERKTVKGCYSSTLGNRYDADTADSSWKCVFCKYGPHKKGLGDLFGPYIISGGCDEYRSTKEYLENFQKFRRNDGQLLNFSQKSLNDMPNSHIENNSKSSGDHLINIYTSGISQLSVDCYEVWLHEDCAIWAPNIFVVGSRLAGLEEATWNSVRYECMYCSKPGALLCCLQRECKTTSHVPCAREFKWLLDESKFWVYCSKHALNKLLNKN